MGSSPVGSHGSFDMGDQDLSPVVGVCGFRAMDNIETPSELTY